MGTRAGRTGRPCGPPAFLLLVLAVLTGLVAMHGLGPGGLPRPTGTETAPTGALHTRPEAVRAGSGPMEATEPAPVHTAPGHEPTAHTGPRTVRSDADAHTGPAAHTRAASGRDADAEHADAGAEHGGRGGGHAVHADPTCAASGTSGAPVLPPLAPAPGGVAAACAAAHTAPPGATASGRAPPSLSELQLLRI
ncbi:DUF6153 family protein [Streptomyces polychromogenes]|uniref:DUF6153 family protein n=1 Tax=Streptomyces polychromogenes TaxID=67342 RepID=A0ABN0VQY8_9ACTN